MYNLVYLIGRLTTDPETTETETGKSYDHKFSCPKSFKNSDGIYETDFIRCVLWDGIASRTSEFCRKGDLIGVRGQIRTSSYETENGEKNIKPK